MGILNCPIIDCHSHVYPEKIAEKAVQGTAKFYDAALNGLNGSLPTLLEEDKKAGITRSLISSVATTPKQVRTANAFLALCATEYPDAITALGTLHPDSQDLPGDFIHAIVHGIKAIKLHPDIQGFALDDPRCLSIYELCGGSVPVLLHTGDYRYDYSNPQRLLKVLRMFPHVQFIGAHFAAYSVWEQADVLFKQDNLWVDCSSTMPFLPQKRVMELLHGFGSERVLFGTDYPMWKPEEELRAFLSLPLREEEQERILHKNAEWLFNF